MTEDSSHARRRFFGRQGHAAEAEVVGRKDVVVAVVDEVVVVNNGVVEEKYGAEN